MTRAPLSIDWICRQPTPYNDVLFSAIAADPELDLTVHFMESSLASHPWTSSLGQGFRRRVYRRRLGLDRELLSNALDASRFLVVGGWHDATGQIAVLLRSLKNLPFALWTDAPRLGPRAWPKNVLRNGFLRIAFSKASAVMGTGKLALERLESMGCPSTKLVNLPYFIDLERFKPRQISPAPNTLTLVSSGRLQNDLKGHDTAIRAIARASEAHPHIALNYRIAGSGPDKVALRGLADSLGVALELCDWVEPGDMAAFYQSGQVLLHPSHHDPYATAVLEGMACGLAVIGSTATGAVVDRIEHGRSGLAHSAASVEELARQIGRLCALPDDIERMGREARSTAERWPVDVGVRTVREVTRAAMRVA